MRGTTSSKTCSILSRSRSLSRPIRSWKPSSIAKGNAGMDETIHNG